MPGYREYFVLKRAQMWPCVFPLYICVRLLGVCFLVFFFFFFKNADCCFLGLLLSRKCLCLQFDDLPLNAPV